MLCPTRGRCSASRRASAGPSRWALVVAPLAGQHALQGCSRLSGSAQEQSGSRACAIRCLQVAVTPGGGSSGPGAAAEYHGKLTVRADGYSNALEVPLAAYQPRAQLRVSTLRGPGPACVALRTRSHALRLPASPAEPWRPHVHGRSSCLTGWRAPLTQVASGDLSFGAVPAGVEVRRQLQLVNEGALPAVFSFEISG